MLTPPAVEPLGSAVRFESQCVVIPDPAHQRSRRPLRVVTKSYALPLWKRRGSSSSPPPLDASHLVLRLPLPTLSLKHHTTSRSVDHTALPSCLVHHPRPACASTPSLPLHTRSSSKRSPSPPRSDTITIPLRPCCAACQSVTDAALVGGDAWPVHFSRAALRRRSVSADSTPRTITVAGSAASASYGDSAVQISVDEIDKRRRSSDAGPSTSVEQCRIPLILRRTATCTSPSPTRKARDTPRIPEEDDSENENELFPLPSPKRTPSTSPTPSPAGSLSSLQANQTPLTTTSTPSTCSGDSAGPHPNKQCILAPPNRSSSSLSLPKLSGATIDCTMSNEDPPSPTLLTGLPSISGRPRSRTPSPRISFIPPTPTDALFSANDIPPRPPTSLPDPAPTVIPPCPGPVEPSSPSRSPTLRRFPWRSRRSVSADILSPSSSSSPPLCSPPGSPTCPDSKRSFSISSPRHIVADVLRGVETLRSRGIGFGMGS